MASSKKEVAVHAAPPATIVQPTFGEMERMANAVAKSGLFGMRTPEQALALMSIAQAEGMHPAAAARDFHVIEGRPSLKADAMLARFQAAGGKVEWIAYTDELVKAKFSHPQGGSVTVDWDQERAKKAGLANKANWKSYGRAMLRARVISEGVRTVLPGATALLYTPEEVTDLANTGADSIEEIVVTPPPPEADPTERGMSEGEFADHCAAIEAAPDLEALRQAFKAAYHAAKEAGDVKALNAFELRKDARKTELEQEAS